MDNWLYISNQNDPSIYEKLYAGSTLIGQNNMYSGGTGGSVNIYLIYDYDYENNRYDCYFMLNIGVGTSAGFNNPASVVIKIDNNVFYNEQITIDRKKTIYTDHFYLNCNDDGSLSITNVITSVTLTNNNGLSRERVYDRNIIAYNLFAFFYKVSGVWKKSVPKLKVNGKWKRCITWKKINGVWKKGR